MKHKYLIVCYDDMEKKYHNDIIETEDINNYIDDGSTFDLTLYGRIITNIIKLN